ncbi:MAG: TldD/PmbA family protein [Acidimicrobiales bacterium]
MTSDTQADAATLADRVLDRIGSRAEAAVTVSTVHDGLTRFANSFIHQNVGDEHVLVSLELVSDGRPAAASTSILDDDSLTRLVDGALATASLRPVDPSWAGLCPPTAPHFNQVHYDPATAAIGPAQRAEVVQGFVEAGAGLEAAGYCQTTTVESLLVNSLGQRVSDRTTMAVIDGIHRQGRADGCASAATSRFADLDGHRVGTEAARRARAAAEPIELAAGRYEVVLDPRCVAYMMDFFTVYGFNARAVQEGRSFVSVGEMQMDPSVSIWDDAGDPRHLGPSYDSDGTPKARLDLVSSGLTVGVTHDRRTAAKSGVTSTAHAVPGGASMGALASNLFLGPASGPGVPHTELVAGVQRGLLVSDFWYTRVLDPKTLVVTGLTRNGVFVIEDGALGPAVSNLRFTQSPVAALAPGHVLGVGDDGTLAPGGLHFAWNHAPSLRLEQWAFTGNASG